MPHGDEAGRPLKGVTTVEGPPARVDYDNGRWWLLVPYDSGCGLAGVDLAELIAWLRTNMPEVLEAGAGE